MDLPPRRRGALGPWRSVNHLPFELITMCMLAMSCPADIHAAIKASPVFYRVFQGRKQDVLTSMITRTMCPEAVSLALRIVNCPAWEAGDSEHVDAPWAEGRDPSPARESMGIMIWRTKIGWNEANAPRYQLDATTIPAVCRLHSRVHSIIANYVAFTHWVVAGYSNGGLSRSAQSSFAANPPFCAMNLSILADLSKDELFRLQAAFLHWELFCRYCGWPRFRSWLERGDRIDIYENDWTADNIAHHRREELFVIYQYVLTKYAYMFKEIIEEFSHMVRAASKSKSVLARRSRADRSVHDLLCEGSPPDYFLPRGWVDRLGITSNNMLMGPRLDIGLWLDWVIPDWPGHVTHCCDNLSRLGLGYLRRMMTQDQHGRMDLIRRIFDILIPDGNSFVDQPGDQRYYHFLHAAWIRLLEFSNQSVLTDPTPESMAEGGNSGWRAVMETCSDLDDYQYLLFEPIYAWRKIGWVFWDVDRLKRYRFFEDTQGLQVARRIVGLRRLFQEDQRTYPHLPPDVLNTRFSRSFWETVMVPMFYRADPIPEYRQVVWDDQSDHTELRRRIAELADGARESALDGRASHRLTALNTLPRRRVLVDNSYASFSVLFTDQDANLEPVMECE